MKRKEGEPPLIEVIAIRGCGKTGLVCVSQMPPDMRSEMQGMRRCAYFIGIPILDFLWSRICQAYWRQQPWHKWMCEEHVGVIDHDSALI